MKRRRVRTADEFNWWVRREPLIPSVIYFIGDLSHFRKWAAREITTIETEMDRARPNKPVHPQKRFRLEELQRDVALTQEAQRLSEAGNVMLTQNRMDDGQWEYIATRLSRRSREDF